MIFGLVAMALATLVMNQAAAGSIGSNSSSKINSNQSAEEYDKLKNCTRDTDKRPDSIEYLTHFNCGRVSQTTAADGGETTLREFTLIVRENQTIPISDQGHFLDAWTFNGTVPGPTIRVTEGDLVRITVINDKNSKHAHTMHMHSIHKSEMDGVQSNAIMPGDSFTHEFIAQPFGVYPYHCHMDPIADHINRGLYGMLIIDPKEPRPQMPEMVMMMNGYDLDYDQEGMTTIRPPEESGTIGLNESEENGTSNNNDDSSSSSGSDDDNGGGGDGEDCDDSYPDVCISPPPPVLECDDIDEEDFEVQGSDPHGFDSNGDGVGCEDSSSSSSSNDDDSSSSSDGDDDDSDSSSSSDDDDSSSGDSSSSSSSDDDNSDNNDAPAPSLVEKEGEEEEEEERDNEIYTVNGKAFDYINSPIQLKVGEKYRIYVVNMLEFDLVNSLHVHGAMFEYYPAGTSMNPQEDSFVHDVIVLGQGDRGIMELEYKYPGQYMFHAHVTEFTDLGWMGFFDVAAEGGNSIINSSNNETTAMTGHQMR
jgi:FtsP/CotA-like multicopper oxidase with cupredoxin domain